MMRMVTGSGWHVTATSKGRRCMPADVRFDGSGNIIVGGKVYGDSLLIKYAAGGEQLWATRIVYPGAITYSDALDLDSAGNVYLTTSAGDNMVTTKVNPEGAQLWSVTYNSPENAGDSAEFLEVTPSGDVFVAGRSFYSGESFVSPREIYATDGPWRGDGSGDSALQSGGSGRGRGSHGGNDWAGANQFSMAQEWPADRGGHQLDPGVIQCAGG